MKWKKLSNERIRGVEGSSRVNPKEIVQQFERDLRPVFESLSQSALFAKTQFSESTHSFL